MKSPFPSFKILLATILVIAIYSTYNFFSKSQSQYFQLNLDWNNIKEVAEYGEVEIDSFTYNFLKLIIQNESFESNLQNTYMLKNKRKEYYFKFTNANINNQVCEFTGVEWLNGMPGSRLKTGNLYEFDLKLLKQPGKSVVTLGDNQLLYNEAKYFRRAIARENPVNFKGRNKDVFNFAHEAYNFNKISQIYDKIDDVESAEVYILFLGSQDIDTPLQTFDMILTQIINKLLYEKGVEKIILIELPKTKSPERNERYAQFNQLLNSKSNEEQVILIKTQSIFGEDMSMYLMHDGIYPNKIGYEKLAIEVAKHL